MDCLGIRSVSGARKEDIDQLLKTYDPRVRELAQKLRRLVKKTLPGAAETVKWGNPVYMKLDSKLLEGTGKGIRHIKVRNEDDIKEAEFVRLLKEAAKLV
ncbi:MAG: DUF1801 domain-containing protein [Thaumarchaeota archaeon]|nr:MAG: DUF1801 domain-containing protein [Nitrososphaerota archaeon]